MVDPGVNTRIPTIALDTFREVTGIIREGRLKIYWRQSDQELSLIISMRPPPKTLPSHHRENLEDRFQGGRFWIMRVTFVPTDVITGRADPDRRTAAEIRDIVTCGEDFTDPSARKMIFWQVFYRTTG